MTRTKKLWILLLLPIFSSCSINDSGEFNTPLPTIEPRPAFIIETAPTESQILPISLFEASVGEPRGQLDVWHDIDGYQSDVCLKIETVLLAQDGDNFLNESKVEDRITLLVDGEKPSHIMVMSAAIDGLRIVDAEGQILKMGVEPRAICSAVNLQVGRHDVLFQFRQTSGDVLEYRWQFGLTDD